MCQCTLCGCWWCNFCGACAGISQGYFCCGFWCCAPDTFPPQGQKCCQTCVSTGCGGNCLCYGGVCCAPHWLSKWSQVKK